ncbi:MAG: 50S ribosomal protein L9 [Desulfobacteraceae bacterium]|nr:50S ribosomal protein L9 [Desulfobacteraceae bacterium]
MKVILKETISSLGIIGSEVEVANGYARNFLLPQGKAVPATDKHRKLLLQEKAKFELQIAKEKEFAQQMADRLENVECKIIAKVHEEDRLYGSITIRDIVDALAKQDIEVEKRMVLMKEPIKTTGSFKIPIRIYKEVEPEITVNIVGE